MLEFSESATSSHFKIHQNVTAVKKEDIAYTSPSTAENQNESEKVYASDPITPAAITENIFGKENSFEVNINFLPKAVIVQKRNRIVNELQIADIILIDIATSDVAGLVASKPPSANNEKTLPNS